MKSFDHEWIHEYLYVWRDDTDVDHEAPTVIFHVVIDSHRKPDSLADNPDDFYGYTDWHLEPLEQSPDWNEADTPDAHLYATYQVEQSNIEEALAA